MVTRIGGFRRKSRHKLTKGIRTKGKVSFTRFFQTFDIGDKVALKAEPAVQGGMYYPKQHGKTGTIKGKQGTCYLVEIKDGNKRKFQIVHPVHLKKW